MCLHVSCSRGLLKDFAIANTPYFIWSEDTSILSNSIWSSYLDNDERIWIGYYNKGVSVYDKLYDKFNEVKSLSQNLNSLQYSSVTAIQQDVNDKLWIEYSSNH